MESTDEMIDDGGEWWLVEKMLSRQDYPKLLTDDSYPVFVLKKEKWNNYAFHSVTEAIIECLIKWGIIPVVTEEAFRSAIFGGTNADFRVDSFAGLTKTELQDKNNCCDALRDENGNEITCAVFDFNLTPQFEEEEEEEEISFAGFKS